jgi:hypothetical protein
MAFTFKLEHTDGTPADPPMLHTAGTELGSWRHDPARACERESAGRRDQADPGRAQVLVVEPA